MFRSTNILRFILDSRAATAIEYGLIVALISVAMIGILGATGQRMSGVFSEISTAIH